MSGIVGALVGIVVVVAAAWLLLIGFLLLHRPSRELVAPALRIIPDLVRLVCALLRDRETPGSVKAALVGLLLYLLSPLDLVPDFLPGIGAADDLIISAVVLRWAGRRVGMDRLRNHWSGDDAGFDLLRRLLGV